MQRYLKWKETDTKKYKFKLSEFEEKALQKIKGDNEDQDDTSDFSEQEDDEPYWTDKENDEECINEEKLNPGELDEEFKAMNKHIKMMKKNKLKKPAPPVPTKGKYQYEKLRETLIKERVNAMENSGLFENIGELRKKIFKEKFNEEDD